MPFRLIHAMTGTGRSLFTVLDLHSTRSRFIDPVSRKQHPLLASFRALRRIFLAECFTVQQSALSTIYLEFPFPFLWPHTIATTTLPFSSSTLYLGSVQLHSFAELEPSILFQPQSPSSHPHKNARCKDGVQSLRSCPDWDTLSETQVHFTRMHRAL